MASTSLPLPVPHGGFPGDSLPRLTQETELQKMLTDEKLRSDQHKINYQQLKVEHGRLQEEFLEIQHELRTTIEESRLVQDKYKTLYEQSAREAGDLQAELEELRTNVITPQRLEIIRIQLTDEIEKPFREKYKAQEAQIEESTASYNKLRYEFSFLKSEYDHSLQEHQRIIEELKLQHEAEVSNLRKERDATVTKIQSDISQDSQRVRVLQRENAQLHLKLKGLLSELEEIRAQKEQLGVQSEQVARSQAKQATEYSANIKSLEAERDSLRKQVETVQRELTASVDQHTKFTSRIHELEKENMTMKNRVEEILHKGKVEVTDIKMEMLKQRGDLVRERDTLQNKLEDLKANLEIANHKVEQQERLLVEKERDAVRRVQAAREEEWVKTAQADNEKLELETKLQEMERRRIDQDTQREADRERVEDRIKAVNDARETAERETLVLRAKIQNQDSLQNQLERERGENSELKSRINQLETEISAHNSNQHDIVDTNSKLRNAVELLKDELRITREQLNRAQDSNDKVLAQQRASWLDEKSQLDLRIHELGEQKNHLGSKLNKVTAVHKKYKKKCHKIMNNLKDKTQILEAKTEEMELEKIALQKCVPQDIYNKLKKQLKELQRRHNEFRSLLLGSGNVQQVSIGEMSFGMISLPFDYTLPQNSFTEQEKRHQEDLRLLKQRLDTLDDNQQQQLAEFREIAHSTLQPLPDFDDSKEKADIEKLSFEISTTETEIRRFHEKNETEKQSYEVEKVESDMKRYQSADDEKAVV